MAKDAPEEVVRMLKELHPSEPVPQAATAHGPGGMTLNAGGMTLIGHYDAVIHVGNCKASVPARR